VHSVTVRSITLLKSNQLTLHSIKKVKKEEELDPILVAAVEAKLQALDLDTDAPLSGPEAVQA
jgi:hypothetical protein